MGASEQVLLQVLLRDKENPLVSCLKNSVFKELWTTMDCKKESMDWPYFWTVFPEKLKEGETKVC